MAGTVRQCSVGRRLAFLAGLVFLLALPAADASAETLTVTRSPSGVAVGTVTSSPSGINCGSDCEENYPREPSCDEEVPPHCFNLPQDVVLTASSMPGFQFSSWTSCDSADGNECTMTMNTAKTVTANYSDTQSPSVSLTAPSSGPKAGTIPVAANANDNWGVAVVRFTLDGATFATDTSAPYSAQLNTTPYADGLRQLRAEAEDLGGRVTISSAVPITIDNTAPTIGITGPDNETFGPGSTQSWAFSISDSTSGIANVACTVIPSGSPESYGPCSDGVAGHSLSDLPGGDYEMRVRATDAAGNVATGATSHFTIDAAPPETTIVGGPPEGASSTGNSMIFQFESSEPGSTFACRVYQAALTPPPFAPCSGTASHSLSGLSPGTYVFEAVATDPVGNADPTPARRTFTVLALPPPAPGGDAGAGRGPGTPQASLDPRISKRWAVGRAGTQVRKLVLRNLPASASVRVKCRGRGCPFRSKGVKPRGGVAQLTRLFKNRRLGPGAMIEVRVTIPDGAGVLYRFLIKRGAKRPRATILCLDPGGQGPKRCS